MEIIGAVAGVVESKGRILVLRCSEKHKHFKNLFALPMAFMGFSPGDEKSELEKLADEFSDQLGVGFDYSKGSRGKVFTHKIPNGIVYQILPLRGGLTNYANFQLGPYYSTYHWMYPEEIRGAALGPIFTNCFVQFGLV